VLRVAGSPRTSVVAGLAAWGLETPVFPESEFNSRRQVFGVGPTIELRFGQPASHWQFDASASVHRVMTRNDDFIFLIDTDLPDVGEEVYPWNKSGWAFGAAVGGSLRLTSRVRAKVGYSVLRQRVFPTAASAVSRLQLGMIWNYHPTAETAH
jgi:hypothetical protein